MKPLPPLSKLRAALDYDAETGVLTWRRRADAPARWNSRFAGKTAGSKNSSGYLHINYDGKFWPNHRIAWALLTGEDPYGFEIDHINGDRVDNRATNLRVVSRSINRVNSVARGKWPKGVYEMRPGRFVAQTKVQGRTIYLGVFTTPESAHAAYLQAVNDNYGPEAYARGA